MSENVKTLRKLAVVAVAMFGFGFALVPFYYKICDVVGLNNIQNADQVANTQVDTSRTLTLEFDANTRNELPWQFHPTETSVKVHPGQIVQVEYEVRNDSDEPVRGQAIPSYGPQVAGRYFRKLDCFCFSTQVLQPHEVRKMPVVFIIHPDLPTEVSTITLSYTFFRVEGPSAPSSAAKQKPGPV
ncbi:MAG: cytochrome c oxidase assembly protein [Vicinamibacterales bacterium]